MLTLARCNEIEFGAIFTWNGFESSFRLCESRGLEVNPKRIRLTSEKIRTVEKNKQIGKKVRMECTGMQGKLGSMLQKWATWVVC